MKYGKPSTFSSDIEAGIRGYKGSSTSWGNLGKLVATRNSINPYAAPPLSTEAICQMIRESHDADLSFCRSILYMAEHLPSLVLSLAADHRLAGLTCTSQLYEGRLEDSPSKPYLNIEMRWKLSI